MENEAKGWRIRTRSVIREANGWRIRPRGGGYGHGLEDLAKECRMRGQRSDYEGE